jgi:hypothetical protein
MPKLFMILLGCTPSGRNIEQHDIFFGIGESIKDLVPEIIASWPEAKGKIHLDAWREVTVVNGCTVNIVTPQQSTGITKLFFINLGGYKESEFEEYHYKMIVAASDKSEAIKQSKQTAFYRHTGFKGAPSHIDDKYGVDVDDIFEIKDILSDAIKNKYSLEVISTDKELIEDQIHLGYFKLDSF